MRKPFIVFEGVDGSGKSEISAKVSKTIGATHLESPISEFKKIRQYVDLNLNDKGRFLFYLASNFDLSNYVHEQRVHQTIVCARYFHSTMIGYASRQGLDIEDFYESPPVSLHDLEKPDITIFLYVNEETQRARIESRELNENSPTDYKCLNDENYRKILFKNYCSIAIKQNWIYIDTSSMSIDQVAAKCIEIISQK
jgi:dTMP kinase